MREFVRQWAEQEAGPSKRRYGPPQILEWAGPLIGLSIHLPWELEEEFRRRAVYYPPPVSGIALIDTGATSSGIDNTIIRKLALLPTGNTRATTAATGRRMVKATYSVRFTFPRTPLPDFPVAEAQPHKLSSSPFFIPEGMTGKVIAVLGRDFLKYFYI